MTTATQLRPSGSNLMRSLADIRQVGDKLPNRHIWHAVEGFGKTSLAAQAKAPIFLMTDGETGLKTLIDAGQLKETPYFPECNSWEELRECVKALLREEHQYQTLVIDTLNGAERMLHRFICTRDFEGKFNDQGFLSYNKGYEVSLPEWALFLNDIDQLRITRKMSIICLAHTKVKPFKNPEGPDYERYQPDMHEKTFGLSYKWADVVLFGNFDTLIIGGEVKIKNSTKGKGSALEPDRVLYAQRRAAFDAKNRIGLPAKFNISSESAAAAWTDVMSAIREGRKAAA